MIKKITNLSTSKTLEYKQREMLDVKNVKLKLLKNSDYTQLFDSNLNVFEIMFWRIWRYQIRHMHITIDNYEECMKKLNTLIEVSRISNFNSNIDAPYPMFVVSNNTISLKTWLIENYLIPVDSTFQNMLNSEVMNYEIFTFLTHIDQMMQNYGY